MSNKDKNARMVDTAQPTTAVSLFQAGSAENDFPVLKAFQNFIDAEQTKARKRMVILSACFVGLLVVIVITFSIIMAAVINSDQQNLREIASRNQELSNKLLDAALRDRTPPSVITIPAAPTVPAVTTVSTVPTQPVVTANNPAVQTTTENAEILKLRAQLEQEKLRNQAEREKIKAEKDRLHAIQVEQERRRLYPEYYAKLDAEKAATNKLVTPPAPPQEPVAPPQIPAVQPVVQQPATPAVTPVTPQVPVTPPQEPVAPPQTPAVQPTIQQPATPAVTPEVAPQTPAVQPQAPVTPAKKVLDAKPIDLNSATPISYFEEASDDLETLNKATSTKTISTTPLSDTETAKENSTPQNTTPATTSKEEDMSDEEDEEEEDEEEEGEEEEEEETSPVTNKVNSVEKVNSAETDQQTSSVTTNKPAITEPVTAVTNEVSKLENQTNDNVVVSSPSNHTEMIMVDTEGGEAIPWLIEMPPETDKDDDNDSSKSTED